MVTTFAGRTYAVTLAVAPTGALERITIPRWASVGKEPYREHLFIAECHDEGRPVAIAQLGASRVYGR